MALTTFVPLIFLVYRMARDLITWDFGTQKELDLYQESLPGWNVGWEVITRISGAEHVLGWVKVSTSTFLRMYDGLFMYYALFYISFITCYIVKQIGLEISQLFKSHPHLSINNVRFTQF